MSLATPKFMYILSAYTCSVCVVVDPLTVIWNLWYVARNHSLVCYLCVGRVTPPPIPMVRIEPKAHSVVGQHTIHYNTSTPQKILRRLVNLKEVFHIKQDTKIISYYWIFKAQVCIKTILCGCCLNMA